MGQEFKITEFHIKSRPHNAANTFLFLSVAAFGPGCKYPS